MLNRLVSFVLLVSLIGCAAQSARQPDMFTTKKFNAPIGQKLEVETGEALFVEGSYIEGELIKITEPVDMMMPGSMMIPFPVHIDEGVLYMRRITSSAKYYCAEDGKAAASFPGLGSVIRSGDCIGIRIAHNDSCHEWIVDNSNYNRGWGETIWSKGMSEQEVQKYKPVPSGKPFKIQSMKRIVFNGYYGRQLHFSWEAFSGSNKEMREFTFDYAGEPTLVSIKGNRLIVHQADNVKMVYEWQSFD